MSGNLFVVAAPSGAGKTSLVSALRASLPHVTVSISHTTRAPRPGEVNGQDYHFVSPAQFSEMVAAEGFLEHAKVFSYQYGTAKAPVLDALASGEDVILEIDWQGVRQVASQYPEVISLFIMPPSKAALVERLTRRQQDSVSVIDERMAAAVSEMSHYDEFDYVVINDDFDQAVMALKSVFVAERMRLKCQQRRHANLLADLLEKI